MISSRMQRTHERRAWCSYREVVLCGRGKFLPDVLRFWSRKVAINDSFLTGTMLPQLQFAKEQNLAVLVMNPN